MTTLATPFEWLSRPKRLEWISTFLNDDSAERILGYLGHPGYSEPFAQSVLVLWVLEPQLDLFQAINYTEDTP